MPLDPMLSLSFSLHSNKGAYALLLGSGISRSAQIPTGWDVMIELIRKLALVRGDQAQADPDPAKWYREAYDKEPDYSELLDMVAQTPTERSQLLRDYFEPSPDEREQGIKMPTPAHKAIARLASRQHIRVIITTNFDRLLELALEEEGVRPVVVSTPDQVNGAPPLVHTGCLVLKVHGDYLDSRIKNTGEELAEYDKQFNRLLDQIFDEFGLIICGWSGEWDEALRSATHRCPSRRYMTYWASRGSLAPRAQELLSRRGGQQVKIEGADSFFETVEEKLAALDDFAKPHPLSTAATVAAAKKYLAEDKYRIRLHDLMHDECERTVAILEEEFTPAKLSAPWSAEELQDRIARYEASCETLISLFVTGGRWADRSQLSIWQSTIQRLLSVGNASQSGLTTWLDLQRYPALLLLFAGGIAALKGENYAALKAIAVNPTLTNHSQQIPLLENVNPMGVMNHDVAKQLPGLNNRHTPTSDYLFGVLREPLKSLIADDAEYDRLFTRFELLLALLYLDQTSESHGGREWAPVGRWGWSNARFGTDPAETLWEEAEQQQNDWAPLQAGLFGGNITRFEEMKATFLPFHARIRQHLRF
ncbi:SIR2-like protein [Modicisalibacter xianhensis]|uniref:SIR2-like protein n=1 Tax=Modicisalibacter xianhensis TaxID=442341 RepID=A0A4R8FK55_9GAMM|nr:SIR2 family protein [Halomonas xianhensis]TDX22561.1 SIR2-like protein [Halomonas xianhensis]